MHRPAFGHRGRGSRPADRRGAQTRSALPEISSIAGGVALDNPASRRVLQKNGFLLVENEEELDQDEQLFRLSFQ